MTIGASVFCLVAGAILTFGIERDSTEGVNLDNVGIILMLAGAIGLVVYTIVWAPRRRTTVVEQQVVRGTPVVQRRVYDA